MRHLVIRKNIYKEEFRPEIGIPQQISVLVHCVYPKMDIYDTIIHKGYIEEGNLIKKNVSQRSELIHVIFYVQDEALALKLAHRWVNEEEQKEEDYRVIGIDHDYSIFD